jgi:hypothetical protein
MLELPSAHPLIYCLASASQHLGTHVPHPPLHPRQLPPHGITHVRETFGSRCISFAVQNGGFWKAVNGQRDGGV